MRNRTVISSLSVIAIIIVAGILNFYFVGRNLKDSKSPMPIKSSTPAGKHLALVKIDLHALNDIPESGNGEVIVLARVLVNQASTEGWSYNWKLAKGVRIVEGALQAHNLKLEVGKTTEFKIKIKGFTKESQKVISLQAYTSKGTEKRGGSAVLVSRPEDTFEAEAPQIREAVEEATRSKTKLPRGL